MVACGASPRGLLFSAVTAWEVPTSIFQLGKRSGRGEAAAVVTAAADTEHLLCAGPGVQRLLPSALGGSVEAYGVVTASALLLSRNLSPRG